MVGAVIISFCFFFLWLSRILRNARVPNVKCTKTNNIPRHPRGQHQRRGPRNQSRSGTAAIHYPPTASPRDSSRRSRCLSAPLCSRAYSGRSRDAVEWRADGHVYA